MTMPKVAARGLLLAASAPLAAALAVGLGWLMARGPAAGQIAALGAAAAVPGVLAARKLVRAAADRPGALFTAEAGGRGVDFLLVLVFVEASWGGLWRGPLGLRIADLVVAGLAVWLFATRPVLPERRMTPLVAAFALVLGGAMLAAIHSDALASDAEALLRVAFVMLLVPLVLIRLITNQRRLVLVMLAAVCSAAVAAIAAGLSKATGLWLLPVVDQTGGVRAYGLSDHPLLFGIAAGAALPLAIALVLGARGALRVVAAAAAPLLAAGLVMSASRAPLIATAVGLVALLAYMSRYRRKATVSLIVALLSTVALAAVLAPESISRLSDATADESSQARLALVETALEDVRRQPLIGAGAGLIKGAGGLEPETSINAASRPERGEGGAHNMFLQTWRALGLLGLAGIALALAAAAIAGLEATRRSTGPTRMYSAALLASLGVVIFSLQLVDAPFERQLWLLVGVLIAVAANSDGDAWAPSKGRRAGA